MDGDGTATFITMFLLIAMSAFFSATETAFSSISKTRLRALADQGEKRAAAVLELASDYDRLLSTILIGNNIVNIAVASVGTVYFARHFGDLGVTISTAVVTIAVLIFGEISPKSIAKDAPERFAMAAAPAVKACIFVLKPINFLFMQWKKLLSRVIKMEAGQGMTQQELLVYVDEVEQGGEIDPLEGRLLRSAITFADREAEDILTHRIYLAAAPKDATKEEIARIFSASRYSRILIYDGTIDSVVGVVHQKDFYDGTGVTAKSLEEIMTRPLFVTRTAKIGPLLKRLQKSRAHLAVVSDEYGGTLGIVTMEDILEELVGEIWDEHDEVVENIEQIADNKYHVAFDAELWKLQRELGLACESDSATVGGWIMEQLGRIPKTGDELRCGSFLVKVIEADDRHVLKVELRRVGDGDGSPSPGGEEEVDSDGV